jgi:PTH1 family peptidyl-tRNA hydrolase
MNSIISALGSEEFPRIRVGIGRPQGEKQSMSEDAVVSYVLSNFSSQEEAIIKLPLLKWLKPLTVFLPRG